MKFKEKNAIEKKNDKKAPETQKLTIIRPSWELEGIYRWTLVHLGRESEIWGGGQMAPHHDAKRTGDLDMQASRVLSLDTVTTCIFSRSHAGNMQFARLCEAPQRYSRLRWTGSIY